MTKWRVSWKEDGVQRHKIFQMHSGYDADSFYFSLRRASKDPQMKTKITDIKITEISTSQVWRDTYHTPVRRHRKFAKEKRKRIQR